MSNMKYRKEIDGLRAIAVLSVIFFHANIPFFKGGFVGVDIFFVISGYLITSLILSEMQANCFSIAYFYERRIRRILPALYFVMLACIPFAWFWMQPSEMVDFANSLLTVPIFSSNFLFWRDQMGYSVPAAQIKPLLHTWSLAVEEQYYLFFPVFFLLAFRIRFRWSLIFLVFLISLFLAQWTSSHKPIAGFLLLPTRVWEFLAGTFIAYYFLKSKNHPQPKIICEILSLLGIFLILFSIFNFSNTLPFPSFISLVPVFGTILIVSFATKSTLVGSILSSRMLSSLGLISYSAYLWHQPIFAFARNRALTHDPSPNLLFVLSALTICLAFLSFHFIENPFRKKDFVSKKILYLILLALTLFFIIFGVAAKVTHGFSGRYSKEQQTLFNSIQRENVNEIMRSQALGQCFLFSENLSDMLTEKCISFQTKSKRVIIFGDSHAAHLSSGVRNFFNKNNYIINQLTMPGCSFIFPATQHGKCLDLCNLFIDKLGPTLTNDDILIISTNWRYGFNSKTSDQFTLDLLKAFAVFKKFPSKIIIVGAPPAYKVAPQVIAIREKVFQNQDIVLTPEDSDSMNSLNKILGRESKNFGFTFLDPSNSMCNKAPQNLCFVKKNNEFLYLDHGHLSEAGSKLVMNQLINLR